MIACRLADILTERGMSRRELARRSGLNINTVCKMAKNDHRMIDLTTLDQVCDVSQVQPGDLLVRKSDEGRLRPHLYGQRIGNSKGILAPALAERNP